MVYKIRKYKVTASSMHYDAKSNNWRYLQLALVVLLQIAFIGFLGSESLAAVSKSSQPAKITNGSAVLNFVNADIKDVLPTIGEITGKNFIVAPGVQGVITVQTSSPVPSKDVFKIFESILEVYGLAAIKTGDYYKIMNSSSAKQRALEVRDGTKASRVPRGDRVMTQIVPIGYISSKDLVTILQPMLSPSGSIVNYLPTNTIMITDIATNIVKALTIIEELDIDLFQRMSISLMPAFNTDASTLSDELTNVFQSLGLEKGAGQVSVIPLERLNSLVLITSSKKLLATAKEWVEILDVPADKSGAQSSSESMHIYYVQNDKASNLKKILDEVIGIKETGKAPSKAKNPGDDIKIFLFEPQNALIIHAAPDEYRSLLKMIEELDRPAKQVLIDALVIEVDKDDTLEYGFQWSMLEGKTNVHSNSGGVLDLPQGLISTPAGSAVSTGLTLFSTDAKDYFGVIKALVSDGKVNILSNPHIVVQNYEKASISVGVDEPIATQSTQTATTGTAGLIQEIEYRNTGTILTVTPQITAGGMIAMSIRQEVSEAGASRRVGGGDFPSFTKTEAETSVIVKDGETLVIGGLIKEKDDIRRSGVPILMNIPVLGNIFRTNSYVTKKIEVVIIITPKIVGYSEPSVTVTDEFRDKIRGFKDLLNSRMYIE